MCEKNAESVVATQQVQGELTLEGVAINSPKVKQEFETSIISEAGADSGAFRYIVTGRRRRRHLLAAATKVEYVLSFPSDAIATQRRENMKQATFVAMLSTKLKKHSHFSKLGNVGVTVKAGKDEACLDKCGKLFVGMPNCYWKHSAQKVRSNDMQHG